MLTFKNSVRLSDYGILPGNDVTLPLYELFKKHPSDTEFIFENGDYYFSPKEEMRADYRISNSDVAPFRTLGLWMKNMQNCAFRGNGAKLWFSGHMQPVTLDHCRNILFCGFSINWKMPLTAEGVVTDFSEKTVDLYIDPAAFPHRFADDWLEFCIGNDEWYPLERRGQIQFDSNNCCVRAGTGDCFTPQKIEALDNSLYRFHFGCDVDCAVGNIFVLRHNKRKHAGIFSEKCEDLTFEDVTVHSCGGLGCLAQFCRDLTYRRVHFIPDTSSGRRISGGRDDGMHITCCCGTVTITECAFLGLMDDPINVHGCCVTANEVADEYSLRCKYRHEQARGFLYWAEKGDEIVFIDRRSMSPAGTAKVLSYTLEDMDTFVLRFDRPLAQEIISLAEQGEMLALDNLTHTAAFVCTKNRFGSCRARGILVSTPKPVKISDNYFASSGSAVLVAGDSNYWFESGECHDVEICNNIFTDACLSSMYQFCEGVISVCPIVPDPDIKKPYHKNIYIHNNIFDCADTPVLYAFSCDGLSFAKNRIFKSPATENRPCGGYRIKLRFCSNAEIADNEWIGVFSHDDKLITEDCSCVTAN